MPAPSKNILQSDWLQVFRLPVLVVAGWFLLFATSFLFVINVDQSDVDVQLDLKVLIKLSVLLISGIYCVVSVLEYDSIRRALTTLPCAALIFVGLILLSASAVSTSPMESAVSGGSALVCMILTISVAVQTSRWIALGAIVTGQWFFLLGSWVCYLFYPSFGLFLEPTEYGEFFARMGGLSHPNTLGQISGFVLVAVISSFSVSQIPKRHFWWLVAPVVLVAAAALFLSVSRTAMIAVIMSLGWGLRRLWIAEKRILLVFTLIGILLVSSFVILSMPLVSESLSRKVFSKITKSGSFSELTTATGRDEIWAYSTSLIAKRPLLGYGAATSKTLLAEHSYYTHNLFLNVALSAGVIAGGILVIQALYGMWRTISLPSPVPDSILICLLINGMAENVAFEYVASGATALLTLTIAWHLLPDRIRVSEAIPPASAGDQTYSPSPTGFSPLH